MDVNNYRPISVLSVIAKVFEKIVFKQFYEYLSHNNLLSQNQSGFRPRHSTLTASKFNFKHISGGQVAAAIKDIPSKKASGLDKIPCIISESLSIIFNKSLISGIFPDDLKGSPNFQERRTIGCK